MTAPTTKPHPLTFFDARLIVAIADTCERDEKVKLYALGHEVGPALGLSPKTVENATRAMDRYGWVTIVGSAKARDVTLTDLARRLGRDSEHHPANLGH